MFLLKKVVSPLFSPVPLVLEIILIGVILLWFTKRQKTGKAIITFGVIAFALLGYGAFSDMLLDRLERQYPPLFVDSMASGSSFPDSIRSAKWIVLLGGGHISDSRVPVTSQISHESLARLVECIRIHRLIPQSKIILSGGAVFGLPPEAETFAKVAAILHVDQHDLVLDDLSRNTEEQAQNIRPIVGQDRFILVTSAYHMPRSMAIFQRAGLNPIPAPADFIVKERPSKSPDDFYPSAMGLLKAEYAMHEYLGLLWFTMRNLI